MDIKNSAITAKMVIHSLLALLENENVDISSIKFKVGSASEGYESPDMEFEKLIDLALKGLEEAKAQAVPEGFVLVPKEPTEAMYIAGTDKRQSGGNTADVYKAMIEAQESAPLKLGDLVEPIDHRYTLASGCERYPYAYVVNTNPFQLMSEEGDMYWCCTVEAGGYKLIKSNDQLPEAVSLRMIREGLLSPVETQEQSHD